MGAWGKIKSGASKVGDAYKKYTVPGRLYDWMSQGKGGKWDPDRANYDVPGYEGMRDQYGQMIGQGPRTAPQAGQSGFRGDQQQLGNMLMQQAQGQGPGQEIARRQAAMQVDRGVGQQLSGARSARPGGSAMAARNAAMASGQLQGAGAQAASMGGLQAQQQAVGQLGAVLQGARGQDQNLALSNAQMQMSQMGMDDQRQLELLRQQLQLGGMQQQGGQAFESALGQKYQIAQSQPSNFEKGLGALQGAGQAYMQMQSGGMAGGMGGGGFSARQAPGPSYRPAPRQYGGDYGWRGPGQQVPGNIQQLPAGYGIA